MKFLKVRPSIAACMGRRIVQSPPKKPAASPEKKTDAASAHSSAVMPNPSTLGVLVFEKYGKGRNRCQPERRRMPFSAHGRRSTISHLERQKTDGWIRVDGL